MHLLPLIIFVLVLSHISDANAECVVNTGTPTFENGKRIDQQCDENGKLKTTGAGGGGSSGAVQSLTLASGVTSNTTSTAVAGVPGNKTFWAEVTGTGAVTATVAIYGNRTNTNSNGVLLATITLSGTTTATDAAAVSTAAYPYYYVTTTNVTGTGATVGAYAFY